MSIRVRGIIDSILTIFSFTLLSLCLTSVALVLVAGQHSFYGQIILNIIDVIFCTLTIGVLYVVTTKKFQLKIIEKLQIKSILKGILITCCTMLYGRLIHIPETANDDRINNMLTHSAYIPGIILVVVIVIVGPVIEEIIFRGWMVKILSKQGLIIQTLLPTVAFALLHGPNTWLQFSAYFVSGAGFMVIRLWTRSLQYSVICHMSWNLLALVTTFI